MSMSIGTSVGGENDEPMIEMNMTPLIDCMLVLIVMLIVTLPIMTHAVKLDMPPPNPNQPENPPELETINIVIDYDGTILWNGTLVPSLSTLDGYFRIESDKVPQPQVAIKPNAYVKYGIVDEVLASAQRNHIEKMGLVGDEQFQ